MIAAAAGALSIAGTLASVGGSVISYLGEKDAEAARRRQMQLEAARTRREQVRRAQAAAAKATAAAWNQGAGTTSALLGGVAQINNEANRNIASVTQDEMLGNQIFRANARASFGSFVSNLGAGMSSLGGAVSNSAGVLTKLGFSGAAT